MSPGAARLCRLAALAWFVCAARACGRAPLPAGAPEGEVALRIGGASDLRETVARHLGKVVLVDFWATWCAPCVRQFPHTVALHREHRERGLAVISVSLDQPSNHDRVLAFLRARGAAFDNILAKDGLGTAAVEEFGLRGDVPLYRLHDRSGALRFQFSGDPGGLERGEAIEKMDDRIRELLAEK